MTGVSMRQMLEAGVHFGHQTPSGTEDVPIHLGERNQSTSSPRALAAPLQRGCGVHRNVVPTAGKVLFVGTKRLRARVIAQEAAAAACLRQPRWLGGMRTNFKTIKQSIRRLAEIDECRRRHARPAQQARSADGASEREKLDRSPVASRTWTHSGRDVRDRTSVTRDRDPRSQKLGIPVVAVVDTNCSLGRQQLRESRQRRRHARDPALRRGHRPMPSLKAARRFWNAGR